MSDFVKQYDIKHKIQRLYVHWDVSTQCNFKCTYCYAMKEYGDRWGKIDDWKKQELVVKALSRSNLPVFLGLLGGEPTIHPKYHELLSGCYGAIDRHEEGRLYVTTNGSRKTSFFEKHPIYDKMYFLFSFHPEYQHIYGKNFSRFIDNISISRSKGIKCKVNVMLHHDKKYWKDIHSLVDRLESLDNVEIHPHMLYADGDVHKLVDYKDDFYTEFKRFEKYPNYFVYETQSGEKTVLNDYTLFNNKYNTFTGWDCWNNNYEISYDGIVHRVCFDESSDLVRDPFYFKKLTSVCPVTCPHNECNCDGLLKIYKEKV